MFAWTIHLHKAWNLLFQPDQVLAELAESQDMRPAVASVIVTSILFAISSLTSHFRHVPMADAPLVALPDYRLFQAAAMPAILFSGCCLCTGLGLLLSRLLSWKVSFQSLLALVTPALLVPLWPMLWPTEMAVSLGVLDTSLPGFPGLWTRDLAPAFTFLYMLFLVWMAFSEMRRFLLREAFGLAVFTLVPTLAWWALILR